MSLLILGITGFLGRNLAKIAQYSFNVIGTTHSESKLLYFKNKFPHLKVYMLDFCDQQFEEQLENIIITNKIDYIINTVALKCIDICQEFPQLTLKINYESVVKIINIAKKLHIKNLIGIDTDKSINPINVYGNSKLLMRNAILNNNFGCFQGVNFFGSESSVVDLWKYAVLTNNPLIVRNPMQIRYFNSIDYVANLIIKNINTKKLFFSEYAFKIKLIDLLMAFSEYTHYNNITITKELSFEKIHENINDSIYIVESQKDNIKNLLYNLQYIA